MKNASFKGKVAIVTGSTQGIGKTIAEQLCAAGACVVLNARTAEKLGAVVTEFRQKGYEVIGVCGDATLEEDCEAVIQQALTTFGKIDILINNASITMNEELERLPADLFQKVFVSNSLGVVHPTLAALPHLKKTKGHVIFISSLAGLHAMPKASAYSMGKMALTAFWQSLKIELKKTGVHAGICYVSFTKNETQKRMLAGDGTWVSVPPRPSFLLQSRETVSRHILNMIQHRRSKMVLSPMGKCMAFLVRYFPRTTLRIILMGGN